MDGTQADLSIDGQDNLFLSFVQDKKLYVGVNRGTGWTVEEIAPVFSGRSAFELDSSGNGHFCYVNTYLDINHLNYTKIAGIGDIGTGQIAEDIARHGSWSRAGKY